MATLPNSLALSGWPVDGSPMVAAPGRNDLTAVQTGFNGLVTILSSGVTGQMFTGNGTTVSMAYPPGFEFGYGEQTANVSVTATTEATANTVVTSTAFTADGATAVYIEFFAPAAQPDNGAAGRTLLFWLYEDGTSIGELGQLITPAAAFMQTPTYLLRKRTPIAGSRTYSIRASVSAGTGTVFGGAGGSGTVMPIALRVKKV